jgi:hypothetical protein
VRCRPSSDKGKHSTDQVRVDVRVLPFFDANNVAKLIRHVLECRLPHPGVLLDEHHQTVCVLHSSKRNARRLLPNSIHRSCPSLSCALNRRRQVRHVSVPLIFQRVIRVRTIKGCSIQGSFRQLPLHVAQIKCLQSLAGFHILCSCLCRAFGVDRQPK